MADTGDNLIKVTNDLAEQLKIKASSPIFKIKWKFKKGLKKLNPFNVLTRGKVNKDDAQRYMVKASIAGNYESEQGKISQTMPANPFHIKTNQSNISNC
jgi:hypothetical protein